LYYGKFNSQITVGPTEYNAVNISGYPTDSYRKVQQFVFCNSLRSYQIFTTVYTSDTDLLQALADNHQVTSLQTPANDNHQQLIEDAVVKKELRKTLYFRKYQFRMVVWGNIRSNFTHDDYENLRLRIIDAFSGEAMLRGVRPSQYTIYPDELPTVFTNNEAEIMLLKLAYGDRFRFQITKAYVLDDLI
jgi:hypothetical protein